MKIIVDENISFAAEAFSQFGEVELLHGREITNANLKDAEILITRSITNVDEDLLKNTKVKFVGTATIGTDHVDLNYLKNQNIKFASAKGCNADAVAEYVFTAIAKIASRKNFDLQNKSIGIVGIGNIGSRILRIANSIGMQTLPNDPPKQRISNDQKFVDLETALKADIVTFHTPLNLEGVDKTFHLLNEKNLNLLKENSILINASRGAVIDNFALEKFLRARNDVSIILDVWENEPDINSALLEKADIATAHVAGYSLEGKVNGTLMIYNSLCEFLNAEKIWKPQFESVKNPIIRIEKKEYLTKILDEIFSQIYDINRDNVILKKSLQMNPDEKKKYFDTLRKHYLLRREFNNFTVELNFNDENLVNILKEFRFKVTQT